MNFFKKYIIINPNLLRKFRVVAFADRVWNSGSGGVMYVNLRVRVTL